MAWIPSHAELRDHPKTRRAARLAGVSIPTMVGHLHLLWHWALIHAADGDLSRFEADDLADAAMWENDPEVLVKALISCGPGGTDGFLEEGFLLHDWEEFGGKYEQRVTAAKHAAAKRWEKKRNADACAAALPTSCEADAEEIRGEEKEISRSEPVVETSPAPASPPKYSASFETWWAEYPRKKEKFPASKAYAAALRNNSAEYLLERLQVHAAAWRRARTEPGFILYPERWLRRRLYDEEPELLTQPQGPVDNGPDPIGGYR